MRHRLAGSTHAILRIVTGILFTFPGGMKLLGWFGGMPKGVTMNPLITIGGVLELVGGPLIAIGLVTWPVAFILAGEMAAAYFIGHFPQGFWPIQNHGEPAVLFCFIFLFLWGNGAGPYSLDEMIRAGRAHRA